MSDRRTSFTKDIAAALLMLTALLAVFQYRTLAKLVVMPAGSTSWDLASFVEDVRERVSLDGTDGALCVLILLSILYVVIAEVRDARLTSLLEWVFVDDRRSVCALMLTSLVAVRYYFAVGDLSLAGDAPQHISYLDITTEILSTGDLPIWTNYFGTGSPFLQFYGFLYFVLAGILNLVLGDLDLSAKLFLGFCHAGSGIGVYVLCRVLLGSRRAAFLAGLAYVLCFWHTQQILMMGRHPVGLIYALLPWPFAFLELSLKTRAWHRRAVCGGVCHAALVLTHPAYGLYATGFLALYTGLRCVERRNRDVLIRGAAVTAIGLILSAPHTVPMMVERGATKMVNLWSLAGVDGPTLHHLLAWSNYRFWLFPLPAESQHWYGGYFGVSLFLIAIAGVVVSIRVRTRLNRIPYAASSAMTCLAVVLPFACSSPWLANVPLIPNFSGARYLLFAVLFVSVSVGIGVKLMTIGPFGRGTSRLFTILVILSLVDLGPTTFQQPFGTERPPSQPNPNLVRGEIKDFRNFLTLSDSNPYRVMGHSQLTMRVPTAKAPHPGDLLVQSHFVEPLEEALTEALPSSPGPVDWDRLGLLRTGLQLLNVRYLFLDGQRLERVGWHAPVVVSGKTVTLATGDRLLREAIPSPEQREAIASLGANPEDAEWVERYLNLAWTLRNSSVNTRTGSSAAIVLASGEADDLGTNPESVVIEHRAWNTRVMIRVRTTDRCYARLAYGYFPSLKVTVDGDVVDPMVTAGRFIAIPLTEGEHVIELEATLSPLRRWLWVIVGILFVGWFVLERRMSGRWGVPSQANPGSL